MNTDEIIAYCLLKSGAYIDFPFGDIPICVKVAKKLFAQIYPNSKDNKITLNCDRMTGEFLRNLYPDTVVRGYHCPPMQQPYFNTVHLNGMVSDDELKRMIDHSYSVVVNKLPKKTQASLKENNMNRCNWCGKDELYIKYHDEEWGLPVFDDKKQFEFLVLESAQAGLSWITILRKRESYRKAYDNFDPLSVASFDEEKVQALMCNEGIIRNERKIRASINNAQRFLEIQKEFGSFCDYIWRFVDYKPVINCWSSESEAPAKTELSEEISKDMKRRGFKFLGPVIIYSHLQATGLINDHVKDCFRYEQVIKNE